MGLGVSSRSRVYSGCWGLGLRSRVGSPVSTVQAWGSGLGFGAGAWCVGSGLGLGVSPGSGSRAQIQVQIFVSGLRMAFGARAWAVGSVLGFVVSSRSVAGGQLRVQVFGSGPGLGLRFGSGWLPDWDWGGAQGWGLGSRLGVSSGARAGGHLHVGLRLRVNSMSGSLGQGL